MYRACQGSLSRSQGRNDCSAAPLYAELYVRKVRCVATSRIVPAFRCRVPEEDASGGWLLLGYVHQRIG